MSKVDELIKKYCPDGVHLSKLKNVVKSIKTGLNPRKNFHLNLEAANNYYVTVKEITSGKIKFSEKTDKIDDNALQIIQNRSNLETDDILFSGIGTIGKVAIVDIAINNWNCSESIFLIKPNKEAILPKYLMYSLLSDNIKEQYLNQTVGSTLKGLRMGSLLELNIFMPPLSVQEEIVSILDKFSQLQKELEEELEARTRQYKYYRNQLLSFYGEKVEWKTLGELTSLITKGTTPKKYIEKGISFIKTEAFDGSLINSKKLSFIDEDTHNKELKRSILKQNDILITIAGATIGKCAIVPKEILPANTNQALAIIRLNYDVNNKYIFYLLKSDFMKKYIELNVKGSAQPNLNLQQLNNFSIPYPSAKEQERIVKILDHFDALVNDISVGLPAEIKARREQYEYYRGKLLTFQPLVNS